MELEIRLFTGNILTLKLGSHFKKKRCLGQTEHNCELYLAPPPPPPNHLCFSISHPGLHWSYLVFRNRVSWASPFRAPPPSVVLFPVLFQSLNIALICFHWYLHVFSKTVIEKPCRHWLCTQDAAACWGEWGGVRDGKNFHQVYQGKARSHRKLIFRPNSLLRWSTWLISNACFSDSLIAAVFKTVLSYNILSPIFALTCLSTLRSGVLSPRGE